MNKPEALVSQIDEKIDSSGKVVDETTRKKIGKVLEALRVLTERVRK